MLILTRRPSETVTIGADIRVTVLGVKGNQVRIGIAAPPHVIVDREEIAQRRIENPRPPDGTRDGDGVWYGGKWHPKPV